MINDSIFQMIQAIQTSTPLALRTPGGLLGYGRTNHEANLAYGGHFTVLWKPLFLPSSADPM
jgi:hypothetical protein